MISDTFRPMAQKGVREQGSQTRTACFRAGRATPNDRNRMFTRGAEQLATVGNVDEEAGGPERGRDRPAGPGLSCTFCGTSQYEVRKLIAGPGVYICDACVELARDVLS